MVCLLILHMGNMFFSDATLSGSIQWSSSKECCTCTVPTSGLFCHWNIWKYTYTARLAKTTSLKWCPYFLMPFSSLVTIVVHTGFSLSAALLRIDSYRSCNKRSFLGYTYISTKNNHTYLDVVIVEGRRHAQNGKKIRTPRQSIYPVLVSVFFSVLSRSSHFRSDYHNHSSKTFSVPIYY